MSFERPSQRLLVFQCDVCFDTFELSKDEHDLQDFKSCWEVMREEGWTLTNIANTGQGRVRNALAHSTEHHCHDCSKTAKADRDNPFRR
jgi:hypothetical protein